MLPIFHSESKPRKILQNFSSHEIKNIFDVPKRSSPTSISPNEYEELKIFR